MSAAGKLCVGARVAGKRSNTAHLAGLSQEAKHVNDSGSQLLSLEDADSPVMLDSRGSRELEGVERGLSVLARALVDFDSGWHDWGTKL